MYLSKLEILGFKSFAQKTNVSFNPGITSIVGPNGCGKTNIVDAIRWCLGEQRSSALRSDKMENVIFNGTSNKKPMGMAEVSLVIENNKGILPTEYSEVTITRRIFRSGESEYLLNKNICRLKDITNLFMDTGIGSNAYSVIELKMVENILSNKAEERRVLFEEAAGVNKYKLRRRLALKKLDEVKADLTRVNDIVSEVEKKVNYLERQAKKADKFNKLSASLRELELDLAERELSLFTQRREEAKAKKDEYFTQKINVESSVAEIDDEVAAIKSELVKIENELSAKRSVIAGQIEKIYSNQKNISVNEERARSLEQNLSRYKTEIREFQSEVERLQDLADADRDILADISSKTVKLQNEKDDLEEKVNSYKNQFEEKKNALKERQDLIFDKFKELTSQENRHNNIKNSLTRLNNSISKLNERIQTLTGNIAKTVGYIEDLNTEKEDTEKKLKEAEEIYSQKQIEKADLEKEINELKTKELEQKSVINAIKDKIGFIQNLIDNLEGVSKGAKTLIENSNWSQGDKTLLANAGTAPQEFRLAVEAALKNYLNNILIESIDDLKNGIDYLKSSESGKAAFYLKDAFEKKNPTLLQKINNYVLKNKVKKLSKEPGVTCWAKDVLAADDKWKAFFNKILSNTVIVNDLETAFDLFKKYPEFNFATINGDLIDNSGVIEAGSLPRLDDTLFGRKQLLENLKNEYPVKEQELDELRQYIVLKEEELNGIDLKVLSDKGRFLVNDLANIEKQIAQFEFEKNKAVDEIEKARKELQDHAGESNRLDNERIQLSELIETQYAEKQKEDEEKENLEKEFSAFEAEFNSLVSSLNKVNINLERLSGEYKNTTNEIDRALDQIENTTRTISKRERDIDEAVGEQGIINDLLEEKQFELDELQAIKNKLDKEKDEIEANYNLIKGKVTDLETKQKNLRKERDLISDEIHKSEMVMSELKIKIENLYEAIKETYSYTLEVKQFEDLDTFDFKTRTDEVHQYKQQIKNLGQFNLMAHSEYEEEKERFEFLNKQRNDLIESEKDIIKTITEINNTAQTLFAETFEKIRANFISIFRNLFNPGDEADLRLEENVDPLEAKIEIVAKPKGKRPTSIELLSGGEKTLTAIALLFAIYLVKPSPFCILDEVDAPLDDANIDRYVRIIREFSKDTQFIVVTHNKRTMEGADTLYGVTMQEEGVSKLVSVRFNEDFNFG